MLDKLRVGEQDSITRDELCKYPIVFYSEPFLNKVVGKLFNGLEANIQQKYDQHEHARARHGARRRRHVQRLFLKLSAAPAWLDRVHSH